MNLSASDDPVRQTRRRGSELESAILSAAWDQLVEFGYAGFTFEAIAARAETSRPVLYRRWATRDELVRATLRHRGATLKPVEVDTGSLRGDLLAAFTDMGNSRADLIAVLTGMLGTYFAESGATPDELREEFLAHRTRPMQEILRRGVERGEIDPAKLTPRIAALPGELVRYRLAFTLKPVPADEIEEIIDQIFLPLVRP